MSGVSAIRTPVSYTHLDVYKRQDQNRPTEDECFSEKSDDQSKKITRVKGHQVNPLTWKVNRWKENRQLGKEYVGRKKNKDGKYIYNVKKVLEE